MKNTVFLDVALVRTDVSEERIASIMRVTRIGELEKGVISNQQQKHDAKYYYYMLLVGKPEGKRPLGRPRRRWIDNIKMDL
jgi:hypothetical protein